jgi:hypothetical protein
MEMKPVPNCSAKCERADSFQNSLAFILFVSSAKVEPPNNGICPQQNLQTTEPA